MFVGDATWADLFPTQFADSQPLPCFDVHDLHSVDDGVAATVPDWLAKPEGWDVLVAHTLGIDHAGHAHGVDSAAMRDKLTQTDALLRSWLETMARQAAPGQPYAKTLALVLGDHGKRDGLSSLCLLFGQRVRHYILTFLLFLLSHTGQTLSGDHGGGSDPEVDSVLVAFDVGAGAHVLNKNSTKGQLRQADGMPGCSSSDKASRGLSFATPLRVFRQADFAATVAPMIGLPGPFANLGRLQTDLFHLAGESNESTFAAELKNAKQVHEYLVAYAAEAVFPKELVGEVELAFQRVASLDGQKNVDAQRNKRCGWPFCTGFFRELSWSRLSHPVSVCPYLTPYLTPTLFPSFPH